MTKRRKEISARERKRTERRQLLGWGRQHLKHPSGSTRRQTIIKERGVGWVRRGERNVPSRYAICLTAMRSQWGQSNLMKLQDAATEGEHQVDGHKGYYKMEKKFSSDRQKDMKSGGRNNKGKKMRQEGRRTKTNRGTSRTSTRKKV